MKPIRPQFTNPPLIERAITVVFERLNAFTLGDYGLFWERIQEDFPVSEAVAALEPEIERYDELRVVPQQIKLVGADALPRAYFRNPNAGELVQVQADRFTFNWLKVDADHAYPHSEATFDRFFALLDSFIAFVGDRGMGSMQIVQCELTNVNAIPVSDVGESFADIATVVKIPEWRLPSGHLKLEHQAFAAKHLLLDDGGIPIGRIHSIGQPTLRLSDEQSTFRIDITARGAPLGEGLPGARSFFNEAVNGVNGIFLAMATQAGRQFWGERDGDGI